MIGLVWLEAVLEWLRVVSVLALGGVVGSFVNVVAWRMPRGESVLTPPSACPRCGTRLWWRDNVPVVGWLVLGGRCRFCMGRISVQYPLVELVVALVFVAVWVLWYADVDRLVPGVDLEGLGAWRPEWASAGFVATWPMFAMTLVLIACLVAAALIDARTFTIPLLLTWAPAAIGVVGHTAHAAWGGQLWRTEAVWTMPLGGSIGLGVAIGGAVGLMVSWVLWGFGVLPRSFADYDAWAEEAERKRAPARVDDEAGEDSQDVDPGAGRQFALAVVALVVPVFAIGVAGWALGGRVGGSLGAVVGLLIGMALRRLVTAGDQDAGESDDPLWVQYPHARREMGKELLFVVPAVICGAIGGVMAVRLGFAEVAPLWARVCGGAVLGYLVGGGVVWAVRILGTLAFGKEAMGLGDVHLMAGVGAVTGALVPTVAFFVAPVFGIAWFIWAAVARGGRGTALPFGPHLVLATLVLMLCDPVMHWVGAWFTPP
ncbi:MAG: A24 family peptidase [Planctomycetota bacterium]